MESIMFNSRALFSVFVAFLLVNLPGAASARSAVVVGAVDCSSFACELRDAKIDGDINSSTVEKVKHVLEQSHEVAARQKKPVDFSWGFELDSLGGSVPAAMEIGRLFRKDRVSVVIANSGVCHSACILILAGSIHRVIFGKVGIHRPYLEVPKEEVTPEQVKATYQQTLQDLRAYFREMNVSEQLADAMLRIDPSDIRLLDEAALTSYGITPTDPIEQETLDLQDAQHWGVDRQEYIRRTSLAVKLCPEKFGIPDSSTVCYRTLMKTGRPLPSSQASPDFSQYGTPAR